MRKEDAVRLYAATDERQYLIDDDYEVYEKQGTPTGAMDFHAHSFYEIIYIIEGEFASMMDDKIYHMRKGDFLLVDQNVMHKCYVEDNGENHSQRVILWITEEMLKRLSDGQMDLTSCFRKQAVSAFHFPVVYEEMLRGYLFRLAMTRLPDVASPEAKKVLDRGYLTLFFSYLNVLVDKKEYDAPMEETAFGPMVREVAEYIERHLREPISVEDLARHVHMSKYHFLRKFKEQTGVTVHQFLIHKRLIEAGNLIRQGKGILEVSQETGFQDYSSFLRNFKKVFGVSPMRYKGL